MRVPGALELVFGARRILAAVVAAELIERQRRAHPGPEDEEREVGLLDVEDLGLEGVGRAQQAALPQIGLELDLAAELELQPFGDGERDAALGARRRQAKTQIRVIAARSARLRDPDDSARLPLPDRGLAPGTYGHDSLRKAPRWVGGHP